VYETNVERSKKVARSFFETSENLHADSCSAPRKTPLTVALAKKDPTVTKVVYTHREDLTMHDKTTHTHICRV